MRQGRAIRAGRFAGGRRGGRPHRPAGRRLHAHGGHRAARQRRRGGLLGEVSDLLRKDAEVHFVDHRLGALVGQKRDVRPEAIDQTTADEELERGLPALNGDLEAVERVVYVELAIGLPFGVAEEPIQELLCNSQRGLRCQSSLKIGDCATDGKVQPVTSGVAASNGGVRLTRFGGRMWRVPLPVAERDETESRCRSGRRSGGDHN